MNFSADDNPFLWGLRAYLLSSLDFAEDFGQNNPEYVATVTRFSQDVRRIKKELMSSFKARFTPSPLTDLVNGLNGARAEASIMAKRFPEKTVPLTRFVEGLKHAQEEFIGKVRPRAGNCP